MKKRIAILGSTGSIGTQTLDIVRNNPERFEVYALTGNRNLDLLVQQAREFKPEAVCIADETLYTPLCEALSDLPVKVWAGADAIAEMVTLPSIDVIVAAMVGYAGLKPTMEAIRAGKTIALANKETLVVAGELITALADKYHVPILPVDSEHSAIFQSLVGERAEIEKILLTASGGPFRTLKKEQMLQVMAKDALRHPNWEMGAKITIDSATMMNKGLEVIEACWLFGVSEDKIKVVVHRESIIHSAVQYDDNAVIAQLGLADMRIPIQYALTYPDRLPSPTKELDLAELGTLTFADPDMETFDCLAICREAIRRGGLYPTAANSANEQANYLFRQGRIKFLEIGELVGEAMEACENKEDFVLSDVLAADRMARDYVMQHVGA